MTTVAPDMAKGHGGLNHKMHYEFEEKSLVMQEILPSLLQVVNQPLRPVAQHLFTPQEKKTLTLVVATLVAYALTFDLAQQPPYSLPSGAGASACGLTPLTPAVHTLCSFPVSHEAYYGAYSGMQLLGPAHMMLCIRLLVDLFGALSDCLTDWLADEVQLMSCIM